MDAAIGGHSTVVVLIFLAVALTTLIAVGGASIWAMTRIVRSVTGASGTGRGYVEFAPTRAQHAGSTESDAADDEVALLLAALERVTEERDKARQELLELQDRWSW